jgi:hypothetical protein
MCGAFFCKSPVTTLVASSQLPQLNHRLSMSTGRLLCIASCDLRRLISITLFFSITLFCLKVGGDRLFSRYAGQKLVAVDFMPRLVFD